MCQDNEYNEAAYYGAKGLKPPQSPSRRPLPTKAKRNKNPKHDPKPKPRTPIATKDILKRYGKDIDNFYTMHNQLKPIIVELGGRTSESINTNHFFLSLFEKIGLCVKEEIEVEVKDQRGQNVLDKNGEVVMRKQSKYHVMEDKIEKLRVLLEEFDIQKPVIQKDE